MVDHYIFKETAEKLAEKIKTQLDKAHTTALERLMEKTDDGEKKRQLSGNHFIIDGVPDVRLEFTINDKSKEYEIIGHYPDCHKETVKRVKDK